MNLRVAQQGFSALGLMSLLSAESLPGEPLPRWLLRVAGREAPPHGGALSSGLLELPYNMATGLHECAIQETKLQGLCF